MVEPHIGFALSVWVDGQFRGSGFWLAPSVIATASHVLRDVQLNEPERITVAHNGLSSQCQELLREPDGLSDSVDVYPLPDLALLRVSGTTEDALYLSLQHAHARHGNVIVCGWSRTGEYIETTASQLEYRGNLYHFSPTLPIEAGMSGGPLIDTRSGDVVGITKSVITQDGRGAPRGTAVPAELARSWLKELDPPWARSVGGRVPTRMAGPSLGSAPFLVSRTAEVKQVADVLGTPVPALAALTGPPGFGKSTVAAMAAEELGNAGFAVAWFQEDPDLAPPENLNRMLIAMSGAEPQGVTNTSALVEPMRAAIGAADALVVDNVTQSEVAAAARALSRTMPVLITTIRRDQPLGVRTINVESLPPDVCLAALVEQLPHAPELVELRDAIGGWPILLRLCVSYVLATERYGSTQQEGVKLLLGALTEGAAVDLESSSGDRSHSIRRTLELAVQLVGTEHEQKIQYLGCLRFGTSLPLEVLAHVWKTNHSRTVKALLRFADISLVDVDLSTNAVRVHPAVADALGALLGDSARQAAQREIASLLLGACADHDSAFGRYALDNVVWYLVQLEDVQAILTVLTSDDWWRATIAGTAGPSGLGRQLRYVSSLTLHRGHALLLELLRRLAAILTQPEELPADVLVARVADGDIDDYLRNLHDPHVRSKAASVLARRLHRTGRAHDSHRVALLSIAAAAECYQLEIPDAMTMALRRALSLHPDLQAAGGEYLDAWLRDLDAATGVRFRTIIASELLPIAPALSARLMTPIAALLEEQAARRGELDEARRLLTLALPTVSLSNADLAELMAERALEPADLAFVRAVGRISNGSHRIDLMELDDEQLADLARVALALGRPTPATRIARRISSATVRAATLALVGIRLQSEEVMTEALRACETPRTYDGKVAAYVTVVQLVADFDLRWAAKIARQLLERLPRLTNERSYQSLLEPVLEVLATNEATASVARMARQAHPSFREEEWPYICRTQLVEPLALLGGRMLSALVRSGAMRWEDAWSTGARLDVDLLPVCEALAGLLLSGAVTPAELLLHIEGCTPVLPPSAGLSKLWTAIADRLIDAESDVAQMLLKLLSRSESIASASVEDIFSMHALLQGKAEPYTSIFSERRVGRFEALARSIVTPGQSTSAVFELVMADLYDRRDDDRDPTERSWLPLPLRQRLASRLLQEPAGIADALDSESSDLLFAELSSSWTQSLHDLTRLATHVGASALSLGTSVRNAARSLGAPFDRTEALEWLANGPEIHPVDWLDIFAWAFEDGPLIVNEALLQGVRRQVAQVQSWADEVSWDSLWYTEDVYLEHGYLTYLVVESELNRGLHESFRMLLPEGLADYAASLAREARDPELARTLRERALREVAGLPMELDVVRVSERFGRTLCAARHLREVDSLLLPTARAAPGSFEALAALLGVAAETWAPRDWAEVGSLLPRLSAVLESCAATDPR